MIKVGDTICSVYDDREGTVLSVSSENALQDYYEIEWENCEISVVPREEIFLVCNSTQACGKADKYEK